MNSVSMSEGSNSRSSRSKKKTPKSKPKKKKGVSGRAHNKHFYMQCTFSLRFKSFIFTAPCFSCLPVISKRASFGHCLILALTIPRVFTFPDYIYCTTVINIKHSYFRFKKEPIGQPDDERICSYLTQWPCYVLHWLCVFILNRGRGWWWIWNWPPGLLWSLPAGWWDNLVWYLPQSIPYGLPRPGHGEGPWGHMELPTLRKDIIPNFFRNYSFLRIVEVILVNRQQNGNQPSHHIITYLLGEKKKK